MSLSVTFTREQALISCGVGTVCPCTKPLIWSIDALSSRDLEIRLKRLNDNWTLSTTVELRLSEKHSVPSRCFRPHAVTLRLDSSRQRPATAVLRVIGLSQEGAPWDGNLLLSCFQKD